MKSFIRILIACLAMYALALAQVAVQLLLPAPLHAVNIIFAVLVVVLVARHTTLVVWIAFGSFLFLERYGMTPFGVVSVSGTLGMLGTVWLYQQIFTNKSWYAAAILSLAGIFLYRAIYSVFIVLLHVIRYPAPSWSWMSLFRGYLLEAVMTALVVAASYVLLARLFPSLRSSEIRA